MTTATNATIQERLRQIAILISSVDAAAARQILLHLPTEKARQVRVLVGQLGNVAPEEKRKILAEFHRSAASSTSSPGSTSAGTASRRSTLAHDASSARWSAPPISSPADAFFAGQPTSASDFAEFGDHSANPVHSSSINSSASAAHTAWTGLNTAALVRFVRDERPAVTAVVVSQLAPAVAVEVLQQLPLEISREVLLRLSRLQEIDPEAMQAIDEHLSQRLQEYQHHIQSELDNTRRIQSLLAAAPPALRHEWSALLGSPTPPVAMDSAASQTVKRFQSDNSDQSDPSPVSQLDVQVDQTQFPPSPDSGDILSFPGVAPQRQTLDRIDRGLIQLEFEQILQLPPTALAQLLSSTDSQTVLLALAGASPEFMKRFYRMLNRPDAKALESRLKRIGAIQLSDVDEAQRRVAENALRFGNARRGLETAVGQARRAA